MKIPFLQKITSLGSPAAGQVVGSGSAAASLRYLLAELPELLLAAVFDTAKGEVLASYTATRNSQATALAAPVAAVVQQLRAGLAAQGQAPSELSEVVLTLTSQLHLLRLQPQGQQLLYLAVEARDTNLAIARQLVAQATDLLTD